MNLNPNATIIQEDFFQGRQSVELHLIVDIDDRRFRVTLDRDSYDAQSVAKVDVWTDSGWTLVISRPIQSMRILDASPYQQDWRASRSAFDADASDLLDAARDVVR